VRLAGRSRLQSACRSRDIATDTVTGRRPPLYRAGNPADAMVVGVY
jgi:hypothetical protein